MPAVTEPTQGKEPQAAEKFIFKLGLADVLRSSMFGTTIAVTNDLTRMPLQLPGHTSIWWMGVLVLGKGLVGKFGSGIVMGVISGILAVLLGLSKEGIFVFFKYFVPGLLIDFLALIFYNKLESPVIGIICGILTSLSKMVVNLALGLILKLPMVFLTLGLGFTAVSHVVFGAIGGMLASVLIKRLRPRLTGWE